jgi:hypothetical protein
MRNKAVTSFWQKAERSLPVHVRARYAGYFRQAERWELALDGLIEIGSRAKSRFERALQAPHSA